MMKNFFNAVLCAAMACTSLAALAQDQYPSQTVKFIVPLGAGGSTDAVARLFAQKMKDGLGQAVVVENKPGAGSQIGAEFVAAAPADGYTMMFTSSSVLTLPYTRKTKFELGTDFVAVGQVGIGGLALITRTGFPAANMNEFLSALKAKPGAYNFGSNGAGSATHLAAELLKARTGIAAQHIPYKGDAEMLQAMLSNQVDFSFVAVTAAKEQVNSGRVRGLATTGLRRDPNLPALPTLAETNLVPGGYEFTFWFGLFLPAKTPANVVERARVEFSKVMKDPQVIERVRGFSLEPSTITAPEFQRQILAESAMWKKLIADSNLKFD